jgi:putative CocE/NonD family hydrolase
VSDPAHPVPYTEDVGLGRTREYMTDDQRFASRRTDVLSFTSPILDEDLTLAGPLIADLMVSISTTDADFVVKLIDVFPDEYKYDETEFGKGNGLNYPMGGYQMLVRGEIMRGKYRNSFAKSEAFTPGKITEVKYTLPDVAHTFKKGHKLMIQIQSSWFPLADRNPQKFIDIYKADDSDFQKATIKIYHDTVNASKIILPVLKN